MRRNKRRMRLLVAIWLFSLLLAISPWAYSNEYSPKTIAVVNFENTSNLSELDYLKKTISEYINTYLLKTGRIKIVEREQLEKSSLKELNLNLTDIVDATTAAKLGKIEGAEAVVIGSFSKIGSTVVINARLIDVETSEGITAVQEKGKEDELVGLLDRVSEALKKVILQGIGPLDEEKEALSTLLIQSNPPGASIYLNGESYGVTPKDIYNLREGTYEIVLSKEGYETYIKKINLSLGDEVPLKIDLSPQKGTLVIISNPPQANVYLDTKYKGVTKITLDDVLTGTHQVTFKKKGYYEEERRVEVIYKEDTTLEVALKEKDGSLLILSSPQGASVYLDEEYKGKTPLSLSSISPGEHKIELTKEGRATYYETALVKGEENTTVDVVLAAQKGTLVIISNPSDANVYLDTEYRGVTKLTLEDILTGIHQVTFKKKGYYEEERRVEVIYKEDTILEVTLKEKQGSLLILSSPQEASVYLDGAKVGITGEEISIMPGSYQLRIEKEGYHPFTRKVAITEERTTEVSVTLVMIPGSLLLINDLNARIFLDGKYLGDESEMRKDLAPGRYVLRGEKEYHNSFETKITIELNKQLRVVVALEPKVGTLIVDAIPWARVYLDGEYLDSTPLKLYGVTIGSHNLVFEHPDYPEKTQPITIEAGEITRIKVDLR